MNYIMKNYPDFYDEIVHKNTTIFKARYKENDIMCFLGETFYKTFATQTGCIGGYFLKEISLERDIALSKIFGEELRLYALVRSVGKISKMFGVFSDRYYRVPLLEIMQCIKCLKHAEVKFWEINQKETCIYLEFPDLNSEYSNKVIIPGIRIITSDTGYHSTDVELCFRNSNGSPENFHRVEKLSHRHTKEIYASDLLEDINSLLKKQEYIINRFMDYRKSLDSGLVSSKSDCEKAIRTFLSIGKYKDNLGCKTQKILIDFLSENIGCNVTKSHILDCILELSDLKYDVTDYQKELLRDVLGNIIKSAA